MLTIDEFEEINLDPFILEHKVAIRCFNENEALHLLAAMKTQYPERTEYWTWPYHSFPPFTHMTGHCYSLGNGVDKGNFLHGDTEWHEENGYFIMDFQDLLNNTGAKEYEELDDISAIL